MKRFILFQLAIAFSVLPMIAQDGMIVEDPELASVQCVQEDGEEELGEALFLERTDSVMVSVRDLYPRSICSEFGVMMQRNTPIARACMFIGAVWLALLVIFIAFALLWGSIYFCSEACAGLKAKKQMDAGEV